MDAYGSAPAGNPEAAFLDKWREVTGATDATAADMYADIYGLDQRAVIQTVAGGIAVWTFPRPYPVGKAPIIKAVAQRPASGLAIGSLINVVIAPGFPTNTECRFEVQTLALGALNVLSLAIGAAGINIHVDARLP